MSETEPDPKSQYKVQEQYDVSATVTIDDQGLARIVINSNLGRAVGDHIPLWSMTDQKQIGQISIGSGFIRNGHGII